MKFVAVFVVFLSTGKSWVNIEKPGYSLATLLLGFAAEWGYEEGVEGIYGPTEWGLVNGDCDKQRQR
jgi:hypothetical protein